MRDAIRLALQEEMRADPRVVLIGEDVAAAGGVFKVTVGLLEEFGPDRVRDTPISETAIIGAATGAAVAGLRPVAEIMFAEFFGVALDQVTTEAAKLRYLSAGMLSVPIVVRASVGGGGGFGAQHSQTLETWFMNQPGLIVVEASSPSSAYGLLRAAIRSDDPVVYLEPRALYNVKEDFEPGESAILPIGRGRLLREGSDLTIVALGNTVGTALAAADALHGVASSDVIDLATLVPWDRELLAERLRRTGRLMIVEENPMTGGWGADIAAFAAGDCFDRLIAPVVRIACPDVPVPFGDLERSYLPSVDDVVDAARYLIWNNSAPAPRWSGWSPDGRSRQTDPEFPRRRRELLEPIGRLERIREIRLFEDTAMELYYSGVITGPIHCYQGEEAVAVGVASVIQPTDLLTCTYRSHGYALALGVTPYSVLAELLGRVDGCVTGLGGSMHLAAPELGLLPTFAIVGAGAPISNGVAYAAQVLKNGRVAVAVFGDGATNIGAFHESLNMASVWKLPIVFVCENNLYGEYTRIELSSAVTDLAARAASYAIPSESVDGQDVDAVISAIDHAVTRARSGGGPTFLEMKTYRYVGHNRTDQGKYRPDGELEAWKARDPITIYESRLRAAGATDQELAEIERRVQARIEAAVRDAQVAERPGPGHLLDHVFARDAQPTVASPTVPARRT